VPENVEQINDHLFIDTQVKSNKIGINEMKVIDSEMCVK